MSTCCYVGCAAEATCSLEAVGPNGLLIDVAHVCQSCRDRFLERRARLDAAAGALRDQGVPPEELNRIMCARVDAGEFA